MAFSFNINQLTAFHCHSRAFYGSKADPFLLTRKTSILIKNITKSIRYKTWLSLVSLKNKYGLLWTCDFKFLDHVVDRYNDLIFFSNLKNHTI